VKDPVYWRRTLFIGEGPYNIGEEPYNICVGPSLLVKDPIWALTVWWSRYRYLILVSRMHYMAEGGQIPLFLPQNRPQILNMVESAGSLASSSEFGQS
jgi:hypothetical protein